VPNSAIKSSNSGYYVEVPDIKVEENLLDNNKGVTISGTIGKKTVEIGSANDSYTEIISGLSENDQIISSTINNTTANKSTSSNSKNSTSTNSNSERNINTNMIIPGAGGPPN
jgi:hypothetical protein